MSCIVKYYALGARREIIFEKCYYSAKIINRESALHLSPGWRFHERGSPL